MQTAIDGVPVEVNIPVEVLKTGVLALLSGSIAPGLEDDAKIKEVLALASLVGPIHYKPTVMYNAEMNAIVWYDPMGVPAEPRVLKETTPAGSMLVTMVSRQTETMEYKLDTYMYLTKFLHLLQHDKDITVAFNSNENTKWYSNELLFNGKIAYEGNLTPDKLLQVLNVCTAPLPSASE